MPPELVTQRNRQMLALCKMYSRMNSGNSYPPTYACTSPLNGRSCPVRGLNELCKRHKVSCLCLTINLPISLGIRFCTIFKKYHWKETGCLIFLTTFIHYVCRKYSGGIKTALCTGHGVYIITLGLM